MVGRRLPDTRIGDLPDDVQHGDFWRVLNRDGTPMHAENPSNLTGGVWMVCGPEGTGIGTLRAHTVREHEDDTISVRPGDGSSNSILLTGAGGSWHGYIERGEWSAA